MPTTAKSKIWSLLQDCAPGFAIYCHTKATANAIAIGYMFENQEGFDLNAPLVEMMLLPTLKADGIINDACIARIYAHTGKVIPNHLLPVSPTPTADVTPTPVVTPTPSGV